MPGLYNPLGRSAAPLGAPPATSPPAAGASSPGGTSLPWDAARAGASMDFSGTPAALASSYQSNYDAALKFNQQNYENIIGGFQGLRQTQGSLQDATHHGYAQTAADLDVRQGAVSQGYDALGSGVQQTLAGAEASQRQAIADQYAAASGNATQNAISRGLGNSTVLDSLQRGVNFDRAKADVALSNAFASTRAGYQAQIGLSGLGQRQQAATNLAGIDQAHLGFQERAAGDQTNLGLAQAGFQNSVNAAYPNPLLYSQLAQQYGVGQQAGADRAQAADAIRRMQETAGFRPGVPQAGGPGYQPAGGGFPPFSPNYATGGLAPGGGGMPSGGPGAGPAGGGSYSSYGSLDYSPGSYGDIYGESAYLDQYDTGLQGGGDWSTGEAYDPTGFWGGLTGAAGAYFAEAGSDPLGSLGYYGDI